MGKGDKKTKRGKIILGSSGVRRPNKKNKAVKQVIIEKPVEKPVEKPAKKVKVIVDEVVEKPNEKKTPKKTKKTEEIKTEE
jgi:30S ribosomal protein S31